jgi:hypothetical protein
MAATKTTIANLLATKQMELARRQNEDAQIQAMIALLTDEIAALSTVSATL